MNKCGDKWTFITRMYDFSTDDGLTPFNPWRLCTWTFWESRMHMICEASQFLVGLGLSSALILSPHCRASLQHKNYKIPACAHYQFSKFWHSFLSSHAEVRSPSKFACSPHFFCGCLFSQRLPNKMENNNRSPAGLHSTWNPLDCSRWVAKKKKTR